MSQEEVSESLELIRSEINKLVNKTTREILAEAEKNRDEILDAARTEAARIESQLIREAELEAQQKVKQEISKKKLSVLMDYLNLREQIIDGILVEVRTELQKITKDKKTYSDLLEKLLLESALALQGGDLIIHLRSEDKGLLDESKLAKIAAEVEKIGGKTTFSIAKEDLASIGGLKISRKDGMVSVDNTFETRLERKMEDVRLAIMQALTEN